MKSFLHDFDTQCRVDAFLAKRNDLMLEEEECLAGYFISGGDETALPDVLQVTLDVARKSYLIRVLRSHKQDIIT